MFTSTKQAYKINIGMNRILTAKAKDNLEKQHTGADQER